MYTSIFTIAVNNKKYISSFTSHPFVILFNHFNIFHAPNPIIVIIAEIKIVSPNIIYHLLIYNTIILYSLLHVNTFLLFLPKFILVQ